MARLETADRHALPEDSKERFDVIEQSNGYIPNSYSCWRIGRRSWALMDLSKAVIRDEGTLDRGFRISHRLHVQPHCGLSVLPGAQYFKRGTLGYFGRETQRDLGL